MFILFYYKNFVNMLKPDFENTFGQYIVISKSDWSYEEYNLYSSRKVFLLSLLVMWHYSNVIYINVQLGNASLYLCLEWAPKQVDRFGWNLTHRGALGPRSNIGQMTSASDLYIYRGFKCYSLRMRIIKLCALFSHDTFVSNLISTLSLQFNRKVLTVWCIYKLLCLQGPYPSGQVIGG